MGKSLETSQKRTHLHPNGSYTTLESEPKPQKHQQTSVFHIYSDETRAWLF